MAAHELRFAGQKDHLPERVSDRDAWAVVLRWNADGEALGLVSMTATGPTLPHPKEEGEQPRLWQAVAQVGGRQFEESVRAGEVPLERQSQARVIIVAGTTADQLAQSSDALPELAGERVVYEFEA
jgi:hypothetical protein